jgi:prepilin-type N-terminal cleavage/methylation domain-containing protein
VKVTKAAKVTNTKKGFTIVELLVAMTVGGIVMAVIAGLLVGVMRLTAVQAREQANIDIAEYSLRFAAQQLRDSKGYVCVPKEDAFGNYLYIKDGWLYYHTSGGTETKIQPPTDLQTGYTMGYEVVPQPIDASAANPPTAVTLKFSLYDENNEHQITRQTSVQLVNTGSYKTNLQALKVTPSFATTNAAIIIW